MQRLSAQLIVVVCYISKHAKLVYHARFCHDLCAGGYCALSSVFKIHLESVMTNHGKRQFIVWCINVCIQSQCVIVVAVLCVSVCMFNIHCPNFQGFDKPW